MIIIIYNYRNEVEEKNNAFQEILLKLNTYTSSSIMNKGKGIDEVAERQRRRKISSIKEATKKALHFLDSFNIDVNSIILQAKTSKEIITLNYSEESIRAGDSTPTTHDSCNSKLDEILFLLDSFGVSDEFYHELSMYQSSLPRSYLVKERRKQLSSNVAIYRLPAPYSGSYRKLTDLIKEALSNLQVI